ncbi:hypothetical protein PCASD_22486 [Puccinia coronata f. sp. avenae]|uniref:Uncharacterized protein n=1 Tax=Puccinia coronata f. sp. avenae TaxID=200324 RepID=A0A2N5TRH8_9BASI|nr:hypothetical protein PCASD_22486 [Puccinia coronata f. sp. avenae]
MSAFERLSQQLVCLSSRLVTRGVIRYVPDLLSYQMSRHQPRDISFYQSTTSSASRAYGDEVKPDSQEQSSSL